MSLEPREAFPHPDFFANLSIHGEMIYDEIRVDAYRKALEKVIKPGDKVADIGTGTGLLAALCLKAGAGLVHAIEATSIIEAAQEFVKENGFSDRVIFHRGHSQEIELGERVEILVTETIGHIGFEEGIITTLIDAKRRFLNPGGFVVPERLILYGAPIRGHDYPPTKEALEGFRRLTGLDFSLMRGRAAENVYIEEISCDDLLSRGVMLYVADFKRGVFSRNNIRRKVRIDKGGEVTGLGLWFKADLTEGVVLTNRPGIATHWRQSFLPLLDPFKVERGEELSICGSCQFQGDTFDRSPIKLSLVV